MFRTLILRAASISLVLTASVSSSQHIDADEATLKAIQAQNPNVIIAQPATSTPVDGTTVAPTTAGTVTPGTTTPDATAAAAAAGGAQSSVKRPTAEKYVPQPIDQEIRKNPDGKIAFNIKGQPWEPVLQWISDASALSLDWQELPADSLNLITTRDYTMEEARDLINRHLLSRGYTMIVNGEVMSIIKVKDLNPALVQRVKPDQLAELPDHTICKVSFDLDWLIADEAVEELKPMLSSAGQIHKLSRTNRLEVIDTAISLRHLWELIESEQSKDGEEQLVRAFHIKHRRAEDVIRMLRELLKLQDTGAGAPESGMDPNMVMQMMQQMQQTMQQAAAQAGAAGGAGAKAKIETRLVLNQRENMILAQASPDQMAVIEKAVEQLDVETGGDRTLLDNINRMKVYRLESIDPQTLADLLQQLGDMDPSTVLKVDKQKRQIIAWGTLADHLTISTLVEKLDQSSRKIEVIPLRRLDAEYVAGTIRMLMGSEEEKEDDASSRRFRYFDFGMMNQETKKEPIFKVEADTENNRLLVNANAIEMEEIRDLLMKLGEIPDPNSVNNTVRVFDLNPDEDMQDFKSQLERYWRRDNKLEFDLPEPPPKVEEEAEESDRKGRPLQKRVEPVPTTAIPKDLPSRASQVRVASNSKTPEKSLPGNALDALLQAQAAATKRRAADSVPVMTGLTDEDTNADETTNVVEKVSGKGAANADEATDASAVEPVAGEPIADEPVTSESQPRISRELIEKLRLQLEKEQPPLRTRELDEAMEKPPESAPMKKGSANRSTPIKISMTPDGKLIVSSNDPEALAEIEELIAQIAAPRRSFKVFRLKYATPSWVTLNLKDFFKEETDTKSGGIEYDPWYGFMPSQKKKSGPRTLSKRRQPQFIYDNFTSTILVRDADAKQLATIEDLIAIYDVPEPSDGGSMRVTQIFKLKNARASSVADVVKDVFRDLLSANDKALEKDDKGQRQSGGGLVTFLPRGPGKEGEGSDDEEPIRFKGLLSIGIEDSSNTLIVSSTGSLMDTIATMIEDLDKAADSSSVVKVVNIDKSVDLGMIQERLRELMKAAEPKGQQPGQPGQPGQPVPGQPGAEAAAAAAAAAAAEGE